MKIALIGPPLWAEELKAELEGEAKRRGKEVEVVDIGLLPITTTPRELWLKLFDCAAGIVIGYAGHYPQLAGWVFGILADLGSPVFVKPSGQFSDYFARHATVCTPHIKLLVNAVLNTVDDFEGERRESHAAAV